MVLIWRILDIFYPLLNDNGKLTDTKRGRGLGVKATGVSVVFPRWLERSGREEKRSHIQTLSGKSSANDGLRYTFMNWQKRIFQVMGPLSLSNFNRPGLFLRSLTLTLSTCRSSRGNIWVRVVDLSGEPGFTKVLIRSHISIGQLAN